MHLVEDDGTPMLGGWSVKKRAILGTQQQVFKHRVVRQQKVRRRTLHLISRDQFVRQARFERPTLPKVRLRFVPFMEGLANVATKRDFREWFQELTKPFDLVVGQRVHGIEEKC